jgi:hypothetical protein
MADAPVEDLLAVDREVARGVERLAKWREALRREPEAHAEEEPLEVVRRVSGKSTWVALGALSPVLLDVPLRDRLQAWVAALIAARVEQPEEVAWALAASEARARFAGEPPRTVSWREAWRGVVRARSVAEARLWLDAAADAAPALGEIARRRAGKRLEVARRLGKEHPRELVPGAKPGELRAAAQRVLERTEDLSREVWKPVLREAAVPAMAPALVMHAAVAREAGEGWPARLSSAWLQEQFGARLEGLQPATGPLPEAVGASSFARALYAFGFALRVAAAPKVVPFALAHEPGARWAHRMGATFASLAADPEWQTRALGIGKRTALAQSRVLARTLLLELRLQAARVLHGDAADFAPRDRFAELGTRLFGAELDARLCGAWPEAREDDGSRLLGAIEHHGFVRELHEQFDADWFRNPRAWTHLRAVSALAPRELPAADATLAAVDALARSLEGVLG